MMKYAPIVMFVYNRADHFSQTYEALARCPEAKESILYIFSDGAKKEQDFPMIQQVRDCVRSKMERTDFSKIILIESDQNKGLARSIMQGVTQVLQEHDQAIVIEDDVVASPFLLDFMNQALSYYQADPTIGSIAGYAPGIAFPKEYDRDVFAVYRSCSCCWATWKDRWDGIDWELSGFEDFVRDFRYVKRLYGGGNDRLVRLYRQYKGEGSSWSIRFGAHLVSKEMATVYPRFSYVENIGCDSTGVHSKPDDAKTMQVDLSKATKPTSFAPLPVNRSVQKAFFKHYSAGTVSNIKRFLASCFIVASIKMKKSVKKDG